MEKTDGLPDTAQACWKALYRAFRLVNREEGDWPPDAVAARAIALAVERGEVHAGFALRVGRALASIAWVHATPPRPLGRIEWRTAVYRLKAADGRVPTRGPRPWWK